jgi:hypothetical protein
VTEPTPISTEVPAKRDLGADLRDGLPRDLPQRRNHLSQSILRVVVVESELIADFDHRSSLHDACAKQDAVDRAN